jgi:hypothetical protein
MPEEAIAAPVIEAPAISTPIETPETTTQPETPETQPVTPETQPKSGLSDSQKAISHLKELKKTDPEMAQAFKAAWFDAQALRKEFPEGLKSIRETMSQLEQFGGAERLPEIAEQAQEMSRIDELYDSADPEFIDGMIESNPESFAALMPVAIEKWKAQNFDAYASIVAKDVLASFDSSGVRTAIEMLSRASKDNPAIAEEVKTLIGFYNGLYEQSQKQPEKKDAAQKPDAAAQREQEFQQRETSLRAKEWDSSRSEAHRSLFNSEMSKLMQGKSQPSDAQRAAIGELYMSRMQRAASDVKHRETVDRFLAANDQEGYKRYMAGFYRRTLPGALSSAIDAIVGRSKAAAPAAKANPPAAKAPVGKGGDNFVPAQRPATNEVDFKLTTRDMFYKGKRAILKNGKQISWS